MAIDHPEKLLDNSLAQSFIALQRNGGPAASRARGPHPLPLFLATATRHCAGDRARLSAVLAGLARYQAMPPASPRPERPMLSQIGGVSLRDLGSGSGQPVLVVPSLINPPTVLDLAPGNSLLAALAGAGLRPLLVDWGQSPEPLGLAALVEDRLLPLLTGLGEPMPVLGYCLGGTLATALAALAPVSRLALLATPWHFSGYGTEAQARLASWWVAAEPLAAPLGALPMDLLQPAFWGLDEAALITKYARLATADEATLHSFTVLEDWSNSGPPLSLAAAREMAGFFADDAPGKGHWRVGGTPVNAAQLAMPLLDVVAMQDRIVPPAAALSSHHPVQRLQLPAGHVGMVIGRNAPTQLWQPLADWLLSR